MSRQRKEITDFNTPLGKAEANKQLDWIFSQLLGKIGSKAIAKAGIDALNLSFSAVAAANAWGKNRIMSGNTPHTSNEYLIGEYEPAALSAGAKYTFVVKGSVNAGQQISVRFDSGSKGGVAATFDENGIAIIRCTAPDSFTDSTIGFYNAPQATATAATIEWACMYSGYVADPNLEWVAAPEDYRSSIDLLAGQIAAKVDAGNLSTYMNVIAGIGVIIGQTIAQSKAVITGEDFKIMRGDISGGLEGATQVASFGAGGADVTDILVRGLFKQNGFVVVANSSGGSSLKKL